MDVHKESISIAVMNPAGKIVMESVGGGSMWRRTENRRSRLMTQDDQSAR
jgi:hypothetical protein